MTKLASRVAMSLQVNEVVVPRPREVNINRIVEEQVGTTNEDSSVNEDLERLRNPPPDLPQVQWEWCVNHYGSDEFKIVSQRNSKNRLSENRCVHTTGNLAFVEVKDIMIKGNNGVKPSADVIWLIGHTHSNKEDKLEWADETRSKIIHEKLKDVVLQLVIQ